MKISITTKGLFDDKSSAVALSFFQGEVKLKQIPSSWEKTLIQQIETVFSQKDFKGELAETYLLYPVNKQLPQRILLIGLGEKKDFSWEKYRQIVAKATRRLDGTQAHSVVLALPEEKQWHDFNALKGVREAAQTILLARYKFDHYRHATKKEEKPIKPVLLYLTRGGNKTLLEEEIEKGVIIAQSTNDARDLINHPSNYMTPTRLAEFASKAGDKKKLKSTILGPEQIQKLKMGGLMGVAQGSKEPARFIILEYLPNKNLEKPLVFVGKGITFDTGGISIKPASNMDQMKYDMSGGAAVIGALAAISRLGIKRNVVGLIPTTENMPGGHAYKPGDVLKMHSGKTVEVMNTDAEGRLILADALAYALKYDPAAIVDLATLTGACVVALGEFAIGMMGTDEKVLKAISQAGENTFERVWQLPLWEDYKEQIKSNVADIQNVGGRSAGTITAAMFLKEFVDNKPWVHLDIAGTAWAEKEKPYCVKGATGVGVRLLTDLVANWKRNK